MVTQAYSFNPLVSQVKLLTELLINTQAFVEGLNLQLETDLVLAQVFALTNSFK